MKASWEGWVRRMGLMMLITLFAATPAQAAERCGNGTGNREHVVSWAPAVGANAAPSGAVPSVPDDAPHGSKSERSMGTYLALHCAAVSRLLLGEAMQAHSHPACGEVEKTLH